MLACRYHKSKNLFDTTKCISSERAIVNADQTIKITAYGAIIGKFGDIVQNISVGDNVILKGYILEHTLSAPTVIGLVGNKFPYGNGQQLTVTQELLDSDIYLYHADYADRTQQGYSIVKFQCELGSTATPYDPYGEGLFPVACAKKGKNLLGGAINRTQSTISFNNGVGIINESATDGKRHQWSNPFTLPAGTYTYSIRMLNPESVTNRHSSGIFLAQVYKYTTSMTWDQVCGNVLVYYNNPYATATFTLTEPTQMILSDYCRSETFNNTIFHIQIEKGSTATPYEPYSDGLLPLMSGKRSNIAPIDKTLFPIYATETNSVVAELIDAATNTVRVHGTNDTGDVIRVEFKYTPRNATVWFYKGKTYIMPSSSHIMISTYKADGSWNANLWGDNTFVPTEDLFNRSSYIFVTSQSGAIDTTFKLGIETII